ncbi:hypothetical protein AAG570_012816 [Ranatra chinensis]|uniref:Uncharacterized protein n=1 Tax=Ranatra chinensis TaxID=642074 RepID=A0ABD0YF27_9HEMI
MASKGRNMLYRNKKQETTEIGTCDSPIFLRGKDVEARLVVFLAVACAAVYGTSSDYPKPRRSYEIEEEKRSSRRALPPSYALRHPFRPARPTYSQPDPLYSDKYNQSRADAQPEPSNNIADISTLYRPSHHPYRTHPYDTGQYYQQPEPIIEIIVKESNETLPAPLAPPTQPPTKEPVHVFYIKYKKNPNPSKEGGDEVIYEPPVPAITPPPGLVEEHVATPAPYEATSPPPPPLRTTTLRTVIRPDSEVYHGSGLKVTFGGPAIHQGLTGSDLSAAGDSAEVSAASHHSKRQQPYDPRQFGPLPPPNDYSPFSQHSGHLPPQPAPPPSGIRGTDFFRPSPQRQFVPKTPFPDRIREPPLPTPGQIEVYRQEKERLHQENLRRQALRQPHLPDGQPTFGQVRTAQPAPSRQQLQYFRPPQPYRTPQHQYHQEPQYRPLPFPVTSSPLSVYPSLTTSITIPHGSHTGAQGAIPFGNPPVNRGFLLPSSQSNHSAGPDLGYNGPEIVKSISQSEEHSGIPISGSPTPHSYVTPKSQNNFEYTPRPPQYTTTKSPDISRAPTYAPTEGRPPVTQSTTESTVTEPANKSEKESESDKKKSAANLAALPEEVPADLREQLLSSGILGNADIQILDYDKVGDIPIENLPPEALENLYGAGSAPVPSVVRPADPVQMKVVRYDPNTEEGHAIADAYVREDATHLDPVVLNDSRYNR